MDIQRFITIQAVQLKTNELVPIWDSRISYHKSEEYGDMLKLDGHEVFSLVECVYDIKTRTLSGGIEIDVYPSENDNDCKKGDTVYYEKSGRQLSETTIVEIVYENFEMNIYKGKKLDKYWIDRIKLENIDNTAIYAIKSWKPIYVLANGVKTEWSHELYHKLVE